jgi:hypothetical protein
MELHQLDMKTAFLNGAVEEKIYMPHAQGYERGGPGMVCHLKKTLYGLRQASRPWHTRRKANPKTLLKHYRNTISNVNFTTTI